MSINKNVTDLDVRIYEKWHDSNLPVWKNKRAETQSGMDKMKGLIAHDKLVHVKKEYGLFSHNHPNKTVLQQQNSWPLTAMLWLPTKNSY